MYEATFSIVHTLLSKLKVVSWLLFRRYDEDDSEEDYDDDEEEDVEIEIEEEEEDTRDVARKFTH